ncbi:MAG: SGNH/GDSL hydrolase family protein [Lachnospiraceae bacterium]|nr:SGNH/GDSL hydrolase family protein [Lachnospiraceae bacterium]
MAYLEDGGGQLTAKNDYDTSKKNVLLIGDSMRRGYCATVKAELADVANVFYPEENCRNSQYIVSKLKAWAAEFPERMDLIQFNCGHWDVAHWNGDEESLTSPEEYGRMIRLIIRQLRGFYPTAKIVFATSSVMNPNGSIGVNPRTNAELAAYNKIAVRAAKEYGVEINDIFAITAGYGEEMFADYAHLTPEGFAQLGRAVAGFLRARL